MTKFLIIATIATGLASAMAPVSARADVGTFIYQPGPIFVHAPVQHAHPVSRVAMGRSAYRHNLNVIRADGTAG